MHLSSRSDAVPAILALLAVAAGAHVWLLLAPYFFDLAEQRGAPEIGGEPVDIYAIALYSSFVAVVVVALWALSRAWRE